MSQPLPPPRPVTDADADALIELIGACWAEYPGIVMDVDAELPHLRAPASSYAQLGGHAWVVDSGGPDGGLAGSVALVPGSEDGSGELRMLYVRAAARRGGLGGRLLALAEDEARRSGATRMQLWSDTRFLDAHRFYARNGYIQGTGRRELHDLSGSVEFFFVKAL
jgi:putative acetyltransferase